MATTDSGPPSPPTKECIGLSIAAVVIFSILLFPTLYVAYKHRKTGKNCWPILVTFFIFRISSDIYYLSRLDKPDTPTTFAMMACGACAATQSLAIIGLVYEAYVSLSDITQHFKLILRLLKFITPFIPI